MNRRSATLSVVMGIVASLLLLSGGPQRPAAAQEEKVKKTWLMSDFMEAQSFICAWEKDKGQEVVKAIQDLGFKIVGGRDGLWAVCKWEGKLDKEKLAALQTHESIRYVEPNSVVSTSPETTLGNVQQTVEFKPVFTADNALAAIKKTGRMICAWEENKGKEAIKAIREEANLNIVGGRDGKWAVCTWTGELKQETINKLFSNPAIRYIEPDSEVGTGGGEVVQTGFQPEAQADPKNPFAVLPQDEFANQLYGMRNINAPLAWRNVQTSPVVVAVCDTGVDYTHEDLQANMWRNPKTDAPDKHGADFIDIKEVKVEEDGKLKVIPGNDPKDRNYHGTHVAGTVGAVGNNKIGVCGVCWRVQIMAVRCLGANGRGNIDALANSIHYAVDNGAKVINLSLSTRAGPHGIVKDAMEKARQKGVIVVVSAGNKEDEETDNDKKPNWPANYTEFVDNIVVVANTDINNKLNPGSHFGRTKVHLAAPGTAILSTMPMNRTEGYAIEEEKAKKRGETITIPTKYGRLTGTSMSAPHVAGSIALIYGHPKHQSLLAKTPAEVKTLLFNGVRQLGELNGKVSTGGLVDLSFLGEGASQPPIPPKTPLPPPVVICPQKPPCIIICPPPYQCPQHRFRIFRPCRRY